MKCCSCDKSIDMLYHMLYSIVLCFVDVHACLSGGMITACACVFQCIFQYMSKSHDGNWIVTEDITLIPSLANAKIDRQTQNIVVAQTLRRLSARDPILAQILDVKLVVFENKNNINVRVKNDFLSTFYHEVIDGIYFIYKMSDKLEPFVIVLAVEPHSGKLNILTTKQINDLDVSLVHFRQRFGVVDEQYHYTPLSERRDADEYVANAGISMQNKPHSTCWHMKIRIATRMYTSLLPVMNMFDLRQLSTGIDPVRYQYNRELSSWSDVKRQLLLEASQAGT